MCAAGGQGLLRHYSSVESHEVHLARGGGANTGKEHLMGGRGRRREGEERKREMVSKREREIYI